MAVNWVDGPFSRLRACVALAEDQCNVQFRISVSGGYAACNSSSSRGSDAFFWPQ